MNTELGSLEKSQQLVVFKLDKEEYGSDIYHIKEILNIPRITRIPKAPDFIKGIMSLRGQVIAVIDLRTRLGFSENPDIQPEHVVIVEGEDFSVGMIVDEVTDVLRVSEENFEPIPQLFETVVDDKHVEGVTRIGDRLIIRLNPLKVLTADESAQIGELAATREPEEEDKVLTADESAQNGESAATREPEEEDKVLTADESAQIGELAATREPEEEKTKPKTKTSDTKQQISD